VKREFAHWALVSFIGASVIAALVIISREIMCDDPDALLRYLLLRITAVLTGLISLSGGMLFLDFITPDDWMAGIGKDKFASAILMSAVVLVIGAILCWT
jgi:hypothetical protein